MAWLSGSGLGVPREVVVTMSSRAAGIRRLPWGWKISLQDGALTGLLAEPQLLCRDVSPGCMSVLTAWRLASPAAGGARESEEAPEMPLTASSQLHAAISTLFYLFEETH